MMGVTHALMGAFLALPALVLSPEYVIYAAIGGLAGGLFPDLDLVFKHRKTLHFPFYYSIAAVAAAVSVMIWTTAPAVFTAYFLVAAAVHSLVDVFGGGLETRPWKQTSDRAVYSHLHGRWFEPRRGVRYDGSPEDFGLSLVFAAPCYLMYPFLQELVLASLAAAAVYTLLRKKIVDWAPERFL